MLFPVFRPGKTRDSKKNGACAIADHDETDSQEMFIELSLPVNSSPLIWPLFLLEQGEEKGWILDDLWM